MNLVILIRRHQEKLPDYPQCKGERDESFSTPTAGGELYACSCRRKNFVMINCRRLSPRRDILAKDTKSK